MSRRSTRRTDGRIQTPPLTLERLKRYRADPVAFLTDQYICRNVHTGLDSVVELEPWQQRIFREALCTRRGDGSGLRQFNMAVIGLAKKNSKSEMGSMFGAWFAFCDEREGEIVITANDKEQASSITFTRLTRALQKNEHLARLCVFSKYRIEIPETGTVIRAIACDPEGEAGNQATLTVFDELWGQSDRRLFDELTLNPVRRQPMAVITTYAGFDRESLLHEIYERGRRGDDPRMYFHWKEGRDAANPASWVTDDYLDQQERRLPPQVFRRLHCNMWSAPDDPFVTEEQVRACVTGRMADHANPRYSYVLTCDLGLSNDRTAVAVMHRDYARRKVVLDYLQVWEGTKQEHVKLAMVGGRLEQLHKLFRPRWCVFDAWEMRDFIQRHAEWNVTEFRFQGAAMYDMATVLYQSIVNQQLELYPEAGKFLGRDGLEHDLEHELPNLILVETTRGYKFDHQSGKHNDMTVATGMGVWRLMSDTGGAPRWRQYYDIESTIGGGPVFSKDAQWVKQALAEGLYEVEIDGQTIDLRRMVPVERTGNGMAVVYH